MVIKIPRHKLLCSGLRAVQLDLENAFEVQTAFPRF